MMPHKEREESIPSPQTDAKSAPLSATLTGGGGQSAPGFFASGTNCGTSCSVSADILFFGANAVRAGMTYNINDPIRAGIGAAAFAQTDLTPTLGRSTTP